MTQWWQEAVGYQIYPKSFLDSNSDGIGDIAGIEQKVDYLKQLGVGFVWLSPFYPSPNVDNGYDISDYQNVDPAYGDLPSLLALFAKLHAAGIKVIIDLVVNHTSDQHHWFQEARSSRTNPYHDWYIWKPGKNGQVPNNWQSIFKGPAWTYNAAT
ncbi:MAG TPA: glucohydrolase, partial [Lactobacillus sp.]|nr:glucohydrolase [Lactobacillus sp.]